MKVLLLLYSWLFINIASAQLRYHWRQLRKEQLRDEQEEPRNARAQLGNDQEQLGDDQEQLGDDLEQLESDLEQPCKSNYSDLVGMCMPTVKCAKNNGEHIGICYLATNGNIGSCCIADTVNEIDATSDVQAATTERVEVHHSASVKPIVSATCQVLKDAGNAFLRRQKRIVGGKVVAHKDRPWAVQMTKGLFSFSRSVVCGGTLLANGWVLSAAHCLDGKKVRDYYRFGVYNVEERSRLSYKSLATFIHPQYDSDTFENDVALIKLDMSELEARTQVVPLCISPTKNIDNIEANVAGWGREEADIASSASIDLKELTFQVYPNNECFFENVQYTGFNGALMFCGGQGREVEGQDACKGDSGSGVVADGKAVVGIVSWGLSCGRRDRPTVYQRVAPVYLWLTRTMKEFDIHKVAYSTEKTLNVVT